LLIEANLICIKY